MQRFRPVDPLVSPLTGRLPMQPDPCILGTELCFTQPRGASVGCSSRNSTGRVAMRARRRGGRICADVSGRRRLGRAEATGTAKGSGREACQRVRGQQCTRRAASRRRWRADWATARGVCRRAGREGRARGRWFGRSPQCTRRTHSPAVLHHAHRLQYQPGAEGQTPAWANPICRPSSYAAMARPGTLLCFSDFKP